MIIHPLRLLAVLRRLLLTLLKTGIKPVQYLSFATFRRLGALYSVVARLLESRRGGPGPPDTKLKKRGEEGPSGSFEIIKILDGEMVSLDGIHRSSHPTRPPLDRLSTENPQMQRANPDGDSPHDDQTSPISLNPSIGSYKFNIDAQSPEPSTFPSLESQQVSTQSSLTASRSGSPIYDVGSLSEELQLSTQSKRSLLLRNGDQKPHQSPVVPTDMGYNSFSRQPSHLRQERSRSPAPSRVSAVSTMSAQSDFNVVPLPRPGSLLDPFRNAPSGQRHTQVVHWEEEQDQYSNRPIPALETTGLLPFSPDQTSRYDRRRFISDEAKEIKLPAGTRKFRDHEDPPDWVYTVHPEGTPFFYNANKRALTDVNLFAPGLLKRINDDIDIIHKHISEHRFDLPRSYDVVLDLAHSGSGKEEENIVTHYYCADHDNQIIFYLHEFDTSKLAAWNQIDGIYSVQHIGLELQAQYWYHLQSYPVTVDLTRKMGDELRDTVLNFIGDSMTSPTSTAPYTLEELHSILSLANAINKNAGKVAPGSVNLIGRFMYTFSRQKFFNFYGLPCARLERNTSIYGNETNKRTWLVKTLSPVLWSAPDVHLITIQKLWGDGILHKCVYKQVVEKMTREWQEYTLFATVLLNANVAFLAIQSVDEGLGRRVDQVASYISVTMSVGSIILGLLLVRQNRTETRETANELQQFLNKKRHPVLGLETLAILFALPYAFLMWGMVCFMLAFAYAVFDGTGKITSTLVGLTGALILASVIWAIITYWENSNPPNQTYEPPYVKTGDDDDDEVIDRFYGPAKKEDNKHASKLKMIRAVLINLLGDYFAANTARNREMMMTEIQEPV